MVPGRLFHRRALWSLRLICLLALLVTGRAFATDTAPDLGPTMRFGIVRGNAQGCEPICPEWISAEGSIEAGTPALFKRMLKMLGGRKLPIVVNSPGGNVEAALMLGRLIRKNKLDIAIGKTAFSGCQPDANGCQDRDKNGTRYFGSVLAYGAMCNSACPLMFAGGVRRVAGEWTYLGVHQITTTYIRTKLQYRTTYRIVGGKKKVLNTRIVSRKNAGSYKTYEMSKAVEKKLAAYLNEMGIEQSVLETMKSTPASEIHQIALDDMLTMKLVTSVDAVDLLTAASLCRPDRLAANCLEIPGNKPDSLTTAAKPAPLPAEPESVQRNEDMRFVVVRGGNPLCNPDCPEWISAEGVITPRTPRRLRQLLATLGDRLLPVVISSKGGDLLGAVAAGRLIHQRKLDVAVGRTDFVDCDPEEWSCLAKEGAYAGLSIDAGAECGSACALMLASGVRRLVGPRARLSLYPMGQKRVVKAYLEEMGIDPALFTAIEGPSVERQLEPDTMLRLGLTTSPQSVDALTGATICDGVPKPRNCRMRPSANAEADAPAKL
ncbi:hypothetical protein [Mesorhizobium sp. M1396]|uniref:COG3904 family protein n=1 Tax=Mesorhizobium sp. M1396 TaxID=2957095 RepID=UPI00333DE373